MYSCFLDKNHRALRVVQGKKVMVFPIACWFLDCRALSIEPVSGLHPRITEY